MSHPGEPPAPTAEEAEPSPEEPAAGPGRRRLAVIVGTAGALVAAGVAVVALGGSDSCPSGDAVIEVDGTEVSEEDLTRRAELVEALYGLAPPEGEQADAYRRELAKSMATSLIVDREAERRGVVVADRAVRDALDRYIADFFPEGGRDRFVEAMGDRGVAEAEVLAEFRQIQTTFRLLDRAAGKGTVTDAEVAKAYETRKDELVVPEQRRLRHLVASSEADAAAARARLAAGQDFATVAREISLDGSTKDSGGDLGLRAAADLEEPFRTQAFSAPAGGLFGPVQTRFGWHVGQVNEIVPGRALAREEALGPLREQLVAEKKLAAQRAFVAKLLADADVCYDERFRPADPDAPPPVGPPASGTAPGE